MLALPPAALPAGFPLLPTSPVDLLACFNRPACRMSQHIDHLKVGVGRGAGAGSGAAAMVQLDQPARHTSLPPWAGGSDHKAHIAVSPPAGVQVGDTLDVKGPLMKMKLEVGP